MGGTNLYSQNFGWGTSLVSLPGRSGLDLNLGLSYNSLVWTKQGSNVHFDTDYSNVTPGFNLGFPTVEQQFYSDGKWNYLMITPSGGRLHFRQIGATSTFETFDSSYLQLVLKPGKLPSDPPENVAFNVYGTDGTNMSYSWKGGAFRCVKITDRNGNYLSMVYNDYGFLETATDTLGRVVTVNYDSQYYPTSITQTWKTNNGEGSNTTHTWVTFSYTTIQISTDFDGVTVVGPPNGTYLEVLDKVIYPDTSWTKFLYNGYGQVKKIENYADDDHLLNYTRTNLDSVAADQTDCPRFTSTAMKAENFNLSGGAGTEQEVVVTNTAPTSDSTTLPGSLSVSGKSVDVGVTSHPDGLYSRTYYADSGMYEGLPLATQDCTGTDCSVVKRWTWNSWQQDDPYATTAINPRVKETRVGDDTNVKRTTVKYLDVSAINPVATYGLVEEVNVFASDLSTVLKKSVVSYDHSQEYKRLGLPTETNSWGWNDLTGSLEHVSKVTYDYDQGDFSDTGLEQNISPVQHDSTNYGPSYISYRGNLTSTTRWDVTQPTNSSLAVTSSTKYNTAGSVVARITPWDGTNTRTVKIGYADSWNSSGNPTTYAYPTTITDPANNSSTVKYRYDIGANVEAESPAPAGWDYGKRTVRTFDSIGRLQKNAVWWNPTESAWVEQSYVRYEYPTSGVHSKVFSTLVDTNSNGPDSNDEVLSESWFDGAGRVRMSRVPHTFSSGNPVTWAGTLTEYDLLGRVTRQSVPTEVDSSFDPTGDDSIFLWNQQEYDWMGRTTRTIPTDSNGSDGKDTLISYEGCGCAGGLVTTVQGPLVPRTDTTGDARRKQKSFADILGRTWKTQAFKWDGSTVYLTTETSFNGRDQAVTVEQTDENSVVQTTTAAFDGHGRLSTQKDPNDESGTNTSWTYNGDDSIATVTDPRGAVTTYSYGNPTISEKRPLLLGISYAPPSTQPSYTTIADTPDVEFEYDALGNRTYMEDGSGTTTYAYDSLSRLTSETKTFTGVTGNFPLTYTYQISGKLKSITDPFGDVINYNDDKAARTTSVTGSTYAGITTYATGIEFRAFGGVKEMTYGTSTSSTVAYEYDNALRPVEYDATVGSGYIRRATYEYFNDGAVKKVSNLLDSGLDQNYKFDQVGRLVSSVSGQKLNNEDEMEEPFTQSISYNAFDDMTGRTNEIWGAEASFSASYTNGRKTGGNEVYDKEGSLVDKTTASNKYDRWRFDAAGRNHEIIKRWYQSVPSPTRDSTQTITKTSDGDGLEVKRVDTDDWFSTFPTSTSGTITSSEYYVRSTVLGGKVVTKLDSEAEKKVTLVYGGGSVLAEQRVLWGSPGVYWRHEDHITGSYSKINANGSYSGHADDSPTNIEYEPLGGSVSPEDTTPDPGIVPPHSSILQFKFAGDVTRPEFGCIVDGMVQSSLGLCTDMLSRGIATPRQGFDQAFPLGHWITEEDPNWRPDPTLPADHIQIGGNRERFILFPGLRSANNLNDRFKVLGIYDERRMRLNGVLEYATDGASGEACDRAFREAGLTPIMTQLAEPLTILSQGVAQNPVDDRQWAPNKAFPAALRAKWSRHRNTNDVAQQGPYYGRRYIALADRAFDETDDHFSVAVIHSFIHSGSVNGSGDGRETHFTGRVSSPILNRMDLPIPGTGGEKIYEESTRGDLEWMGEKYNAIIAACTREGSSRVGPARGK